MCAIHNDHGTSLGLSQAETRRSQLGAGRLDECVHPDGSPAGREEDSGRRRGDARSLGGLGRRAYLQRRGGKGSHAALTGAVAETSMGIAATRPCPATPTTAQSAVGYQCRHALDPARRPARGMGHVSIISTAYYLRWMPAVVACASERFERSFGRLVQGGKP
jgi:hypothetical protein